MISTCFLRNNGQNGVFNSIQVQVFNIEHLRMTDAQARRPVLAAEADECLSGTLPETLR
jgi:hypothetical protein